MPTLNNNKGGEGRCGSSRGVSAFRMEEDYYEILEISRNANHEEIKSVYRRLALKCHPDRNPGDKQAEEQFKLISEAYQVLSDSEKRRLYDLYGHAGLADLDVGGFGGFDDIFTSFGEIFEDFFSSGRRRRTPPRARPGADLRQRVDLTLEQVVTGVEAALEVDRRVSCDKCRGSGLKSGTRRKTCPACGGRGQVQQNRGILRVVTTCTKCQGAGSIIASPCPDCRGNGVVRERKRVQVRIPPGVDNGTRLRLRGEGEPGMHGGPPGDLYIEARVAAHPLFLRDGNHLLYKARLSFVEAALGAEIDIPTLNSKSRLKIPSGTQAGAVFRLKGEGVPDVRCNGRGDLLIEVDLKTPTELTTKQEKLLKEFLKLEERQK